MSPSTIAIYGAGCAALACLYTLVELRRRGRPWHRNCYSQAWLDGWSVTHVGHGIVMFGIAKAVFPGTFYEPLGFVIAAEAIWESFENRNWVIRMFRRAGDKNYFGDSVANSAGDILACIVGALFTGFFV